MPDQKRFFVSGLPRAGSTLLCNLLAQHPDAFVTPTSACHETLFQLRNTWNTWAEHKADKAAAHPKNLARMMGAMLLAYHDTDKPIIVDKARSWVHSIEMLEAALGHKAKILVPVRDIAECAASFEMLHRKNAHLANVPGDFLSSQTTEGRVRHWTGATGEIGIAYNRIKDALRRGYADRLLFVEFDELSSNPAATMDKVWRFLEVDPPQHDFNNVKQVTIEDDSIHGYQGMHDVHPVVRALPKKANHVLGLELASSFKHTNFWR